MADDGAAPAVTDDEITGHLSDKPASRNSSSAGPPTPGSSAASAQPARLDDSRILRAFARYGWEPETNEEIPGRFRTDAIFPLPSPLAEESLWKKEWTDKEKSILSQWEAPLQLLWQRFRGWRKQLRRGIPNDSTTPFLGMFQKEGFIAGHGKGKKPKKSNGSMPKPRLIPCELQDGVYELDLQSIDVFSSVPEVKDREHLRGKVLQIRKMVHRESRAEGFFIVNSEIRNIRIYGREHRPPRPPVIFGPLPSFATINIGPSLPIFWWRNVKGFDFSPDPEAVAAESKKRKMGGENGFDSDEDEIPKFRRQYTEREFQHLILKTVKKVSSSSGEHTVTWRSRLEARLDRHRSCKLRKAEQKKEFLQLESLNMMTQEGIILAVASLWEALRRKNISFAFGHHSTYAPPATYTKPSADEGVVTGDRGLLMPLLLPNETADKVGHYVFAIAYLERYINGKPLVRIDIFDSKRAVLDFAVVEGEARRIVMESGWLGPLRRPNGELIEPLWSGAHDIEVPEQLELDCGFSVIINAWAVMLGIPIQHGDRGRREVDGYYDDQAFLDQGLEIVNLALAGCMDSETIQAFLNTHGYSAEQSVDNEQEAVQHATTFRMNEGRFIEIFRKENRLRRWRATGSVQRVEIDGLCLKVYEKLSELGCVDIDHERIIEALVVEGNVVEQAVMRLMGSPLLQTPSPTNANKPEPAGSGRK